MTGTDGRALPGGTAHSGRVIRRGREVYRPCGPYSGAVHALLEHLAERGFAHAPRLLHTDGTVEALTYLDGEAAYRPGSPGTMPMPDWAQTDSALSSVADLLRGFHDASADFDPAHRVWQRPVPAPWAGPRVTHNDVHPANVIFRDGRAAGLIDFDLAGPGSIAFDIAVAACFWVPILDPADVPDSRQGRQFDRLALFLDAYGADRELRADVVRALPAGSKWIFDIIRDAAALGHPAFSLMWALRKDMSRRARSWLRANRAALGKAADAASEIAR